MRGDDGLVVRVALLKSGYEKLATQELMVVAHGERLRLVMKMLE